MPSRPWNPSPNGGPSSLWDLIAASAASRPDAVAVCAPGRPPLPFGRLHDHLHAVHRSLRRLGIGPKDRVALVCADGPELAVALLATAASTTCAPLNPAYRANEYDFYLSDLKVSALLLQSDLDSAARQAASRQGLPVIELQFDGQAEAGLFTISGVADSESPESTSGEFAADDATAIVMHTSGTTERAKRVPVTHVNLCVGARSAVTAFNLTARDRCLNLMPLYHGVGVYTTFAALAAGGSVVCPPLHDIGAFFAWLEELRPSWYSATPPIHHAILARAPEHRATISRVPLRFIRSGTGELAPGVREKIEQTFAVPVIETYGMTETSIICCGPMPPRRRKIGSVGVTIGLAVAIMDEGGKLAPPETIGEVVVRGPTVTPGYEDLPEANVAAFCEGWFKTGDLGALDGGGYLFLKGRLKELINRGGQKVSPHEVEGVLLAYPDVAEAVVFPNPHPTLGEEVAAAVVLRTHAQATEQDLRRWVAARVADFKVPRRIVAVKEIPTTGPTGKVRRAQLAEYFRPELQSPYRMAEGPLEAMLARFWSEELGVNRVGLHDNFFDLGGDSLSGTRICERIIELTAQSVSVATLLRAPTVAELARLLREAGPARPRDTRLVPIRAGGSRPPLFCLHGATGFVTDYYLLTRHLGPDQPVYGVQAAWADGPPPSSIRFEDIAAQYVREMRTFFPQGPYLLCGYSVGGLLAWEVAQQLLALGQQVALLVLLDTHMRVNPALPLEPASGLPLFLRRVQFHLDTLRALSPQDRIAYGPQRLRARLSRSPGDASPGTAWPDLRAPIGSWIDTVPALWKMVIEAGIAYVPRPYPWQIAVFLVQQSDEDPRYDIRRPGSLATGRVEIHRVPGGHMSFIKEPHVRVLAKKLRLCLDRAIESARDRDFAHAVSQGPVADDRGRAGQR